MDQYKQRVIKFVINCLTGSITTVFVLSIYCLLICIMVLIAINESIKYIIDKIYKYQEDIMYDYNFRIDEFRTWSKGQIPWYAWYHRKQRVYYDEEMDVFFPLNDFLSNDIGGCYITTSYKLYFLRKSDQVLYKLSF